MNDLKKVSVVLPTYNCAEYLDRAIQSVLNQTYKNIELIIVNDGSTDDTSKILDKYKDLSNAKIINQENMGANPARNNGAKYATGEYLIFMESDVILNPQIIENMARILDEKPQISYVYCDYKLSGRMEGVLIAKPFNIEELLKMNYISAISLMRREHFPGFDPEIKGFQDWDMWLTMYENGHIGEYMPGIYLEAIQREGGISESVHKNWNERVLDIYGKHKRVAIITLTWNRLDYTKRALESLDKTSNRRFHHIFVDQGSDDGTLEFLLKRKEEKGNITIISNKINTGLSHAYNQALEIIGPSYDYVLHFDNDCEILSDNCLKEVMKLACITNNQLLLSPKVLGIHAVIPRFQHANILNHQVGLVPHLGGIFTLVPIDIFQNFRYDESVPIYGGHQDSQLSQYVMLNGRFLGYVEDLSVMHMDTTDGQAKKYPEYCETREDLRKISYKDIEHLNEVKILK